MDEQGQPIGELTNLIERHVVELVALRQRVVQLEGDLGEMTERAGRRKRKLVTQQRYWEDRQREQDRVTRQQAAAHAAASAEQAQVIADLQAQVERLSQEQRDLVAVNAQNVALLRTTQEQLRASQAQVQQMVERDHAWAAAYHRLDADADEFWAWLLQYQGEAEWLGATLEEFDALLRWRTAENAVLERNLMTLVVHIQGYRWPCSNEVPLLEDRPPAPVFSRWRVR